jgi:hypothetical protein
MPGIGNGGFDILPFVEGRVVHDNHASGQELGQKVLRHPRIEDVGVDIGGKQAHGQERPFDQSTDDIGSASCMPIFYTMAALTHRRIAMRTRHVMRKAAFIKVNDDAACALIAFNFLPEDAPLCFAGLWMTQAFFYKSHPDALKRD